MLPFLRQENFSTQRLTVGSESLVDPLQVAAQHASLE